MFLPFMPDTNPSQQQFLKDLDKSRAERDKLTDVLDRTRTLIQIDPSSRVKRDGES